MITVPILTKTIHAAHDWQRLPIKSGMEAYKCAQCGALKVIRFGLTSYTVPDCDIEQTNQWYKAEQQCYTWGVKERQAV